MKTVLVIGDNPHNLRFAEAVLRKGGYAVLSATDGTSGLELARTALPDAILMDIQMPGMDGLAVTRLIKADPLTARIKVLALTALAMQGDERRVHDAGCDAYLAKPYRYQELLDCLSLLIAG